MGSFFHGLYKNTSTVSHSDSGFTNTGTRPTVKYTCPANTYAIAIIESGSFTVTSGILNMLIYNSNLTHLKSRYIGTSTSSTTIMVPGEVFLRAGDSLIAEYVNQTNTSLPCSGTITIRIFEFALGTA